MNDINKSDVKKTERYYRITVSQHNYTIKKYYQKGFDDGFAAGLNSRKKVNNLHEAS